MTGSEPYTPDINQLLDGLGTDSIAAALMVAEHAVRVGQRDLGLALCERLAMSRGDEPAINLHKASILARCHAHEQALRVLQALRQRYPELLLAAVYEGMLWIDLREPRRACSLFRSVLRQCPDFPGVANMLATVAMPGSPYREVLAWIHRQLLPRGYLEIGVESGASFALSQAAVSVGIDPDLSRIPGELRTGTYRLFEMTSSEFFEKHEPELVFGDVALDLVFVDGLHRFDQVLRDFSNLERWSHSGTVVLIHDCLPISEVVADSKRRSRFWPGDVWKAIVALQEVRPDLSISVVPTSPAGLAIIRGLDRSSDIVSDNLDALVQRYRDLVLPSPDQGWPPSLPVVSNDTSGWLGALGL